MIDTSLAERLKEMILNYRSENGKTADFGDNNEYLEIIENKMYLNASFFGFTCFSLMNYKKKGLCVTFNDAVVKEKSLWIKEIETFKDIPITDLEEIFSIVSFDKLYEFAYDHTENETFSCCSRYEQCSDAKKCIHPDIMFASGCYYLRNLRNGKIFYGVNKNV